MALLRYHAFGLHITDSIIKVAELVPVDNTFTPIAYGEVAIPPGIVVDGFINDAEVLAGYINKLKQQLAWGKLTTDFVVCSLPESRVFLKVITIPHFPRKQLDEAISWEAQSLIPLPVEQAYFETQIIKTKEKEVDVLVAATDKKLVDSYVSTLTLAKLTPISIDLECNAVGRAIVEQNINKTALEIHVGDKTTTLSVFRGGKLLFSNTIPHGLLHLVADFSTTPKLNREEGIEILQTAGVAQLSRTPTISAVGNGITSTITFYNSQLKSPDEKIEHVILTGSYAHTQGLFEKLQPFIGLLPFTIATPKVTINKELQDVGCEPLSTSIGLALRGVHPMLYEGDLNFLPLPFVQRIETQEIQKKIVRTISIFSYITFLVIIILIVSYFALKRDNRLLEENVKYLNEQMTNHPAKKLYPWIQEKNALLTLLDSVESKRLPYTAILQRINKIIPQNVSLVSLAIDESKSTIEIVGNGKTREAIVAFVKKLDQEKVFKDVSILYSSFGEESNPAFTLSLAFDKKLL